MRSPHGHQLLPLLSCLLFLSLPCRADYFLDSVAGNDSNTGTNYWSAWKTVAKFTSAVGVNCSNATIWAACGSVFQHELRIGNGNTIDAYPESGPRPVFDGSEAVTNWGPVCAVFTNVYSVSNFVVTGGSTPSTIPVIEDGTIMISVDSLVACDATDGSFFSTDTPLAGSANVVFINPSGVLPPASNGKTYKVAKRNYAIVGGDNNTIKNVVCQNAMGNNGSVYLGKNSKMEEVLLLNGTYHHVLIESGHLKRVLTWKASHRTGQSIPFVAYSQTDGLSVKFTKCEAVGISPSRLLSDGFYGHTAGLAPDPGYAYAKFEDCTVTYAGGFGSIAIKTNGIHVLNRCKTIGTSVRGFVTYSGINYILDCEFLTLPGVGFVSSGIPVQIAGGAGARTYISGLKCSMSDASGPFNIRITANNAWLSVVDSVIGYGNTIGFSGTAITNLTLSVSNCVIGSGQAYGFTGSVPIFTGDSNSYTFSPLQMNVYWGNNTQLSWGQFKSLVAPYESNSTTNDARWIGWPVNGNYTYDYRSPIVTNRAGPGWRPSAHQSVNPLLQDIDPWLPPNLATGVKP